MKTTSHNIYGSSRLGVVDAKVNRNPAPHSYERKLQAKNYELSDHLGNVVATISDKKIHPQELVAIGSQNVDPLLGFQADLTGAYDYYPFGMEIQARSGSFTAIDYTEDTDELVYDGLPSNCADYVVVPGANGVYTKECSTAVNDFGQTYMASYATAQNDTSEYFRVELMAPIAEVLPNLQAGKLYSIELTIGNTEHRNCSFWFDGQSYSAQAHGATTGGQIRSSSEKFFLASDFTGDHLQNIAINGKLELDIRFNKGVKNPHSLNPQIVNLRIYETSPNTQVQFAQRDEAAYTYGFGSDLRDDEKRGSGRGYEFGGYDYDPAKGTRSNPDPLAYRMPGISPYAVNFNNPILYFDPNGEFPWSVHVRSFISTPTTVGGLFYGDGRGASFGGTSRVRSSFTVDPTARTVTQPRAVSDPTIFFGIAGHLPPMVDQGLPTASNDNISFSGSTASFDFSHSGKDPITPQWATPALNVHAGLSFNEDLDKGILTVTGSFTGDEFPSTESFITDQSGETKLFLGAQMENGGIHSLVGDNKEKLFNVNMQIMFNDEGNFTGVQQGETTYSVEDWNKKVQTEFKK